MSQGCHILPLLRWWKVEVVNRIRLKMEDPGHQTIYMLWNQFLVWDWSCSLLFNCCRNPMGFDGREISGIYQIYSSKTSQSHRSRMIILLLFLFLVDSTRYIGIDEIKMVMRSHAVVIQTSVLLKRHQYCSEVLSDNWTEILIILLPVWMAFQQVSWIQGDTGHFFCV